nr:unnamed protein product [Callosobruchus analis]
MISNQAGAVQQIQKSAPLAIRSACYNHALNLSLSKLYDVQAIRNCMGSIKEVVSFFTSPAKRNFVSKDIYGGQLISLCETISKLFQSTKLTVEATC